MIKKYSAKTHISLSVPFANGGVKHISFRQMTGGGSVYFTSDPGEQNALESHSKFGRLFKLESATLESSGPESTNTAGIEESSVVPAVPGNEGAASTAKGTVQVTVPSLADAKEYLAEKFGISRSKLRSEASIKAAAKAHNIEFVGI